jgi:hypothetical protein
MVRSGEEWLAPEEWPLIVLKGANERGLSDLASADDGDDSGLLETGPHLLGEEANGPLRGLF